MLTIITKLALDEALPIIKPCENFASACTTTNLTILIPKTFKDSDLPKKKHMFITSFVMIFMR